MAIKTFTSGEVLTASDTNTFLANSGLVFVKSDSITSGSSKEITAVFSSTYDNYRIVISNFESNVAFGLNFTLGSSATGANYFWSGVIVSYSNGAVSGEYGNNGSNFNTGIVGAGAKGGGVIEIQSPNRALVTTLQAQATDGRTTGAGGRNNTGMLNNTTQYTSFTLSVGGNTFVSCDVTVYGYRKP